MFWRQRDRNARVRRRLADVIARTLIPKVAPSPDRPHRSRRRRHFNMRSGRRRRFPRQVARVHLQRLQRSGRASRIRRPGTRRDARYPPRYRGIGRIRLDRPTMAGRVPRDCSTSSVPPPARRPPLQRHPSRCCARCDRASGCTAASAPRRRRDPRRRSGRSLHSRRIDREVLQQEPFAFASLSCGCCGREGNGASGFIPQGPAWPCLRAPCDCFRDIG